MSRMRRRQFLINLLTCGATVGAVGGIGGCGTLLHSERIHQPHSRDLDWKMVALNGLGLMFFFVPGVIAFVVDFHTGALYLPPREMMMHPAMAQRPAIEEAPTVSEHESPPAMPAAEATPQRVTLNKVPVGGGELNLAVLEERVGHYVGQPVSLTDPAARLSRLESIEEFERAHHRHQNDRRFGLAPKRFFQRWLPQLLLG